MKCTECGNVIQYGSVLVAEPDEGTGYWFFHHVCYAVWMQKMRHAHGDRAVLIGVNNRRTEETLGLLAHTEKPRD